MARPSRARRLANGLSTELAELRQVAAGGASLPPATRARLLEAVFVRAFTEFEWFLEELFFAVLTRATRIENAGPRVGIRDPALARVITSSGQRYLSWLPLEDTVARAERLLLGGEPFVRLATRSTVRTDLKRGQAIRNATAHKSQDALARFQAVTSNSYSTAGDFLASSAGGSTACDAILADLSRYGHALVGTRAQAEHLLGPRDAFRARAKPGAGSYVCQGCGAIYVLTDAQTRLGCPPCDPPCAACGHRSESATFLPN